MRPGRRYRVEALFKCDGVLSPGSSVRAILSNKTTSDHDEMFFYDHLDYLGEREGWHVVGQTIAAEEDTPELTLNLFLSWEASGRVLWGDPRLYDISEVEARRPVRFAAISGNPENPKSPAECIAFYCEKLDEIPEADLVVLPELINATRLDMQRMNTCQTRHAAEVFTLPRACWSVKPTPSTILVSSSTEPAASWGDTARPIWRQGRICCRALLLATIIPYLKRTSAT